MDIRRVLKACLAAYADAAERAFSRLTLGLFPLWFDKPSAPPPPDYTGAAQASGQSNIQASIANALLSQKNQNTPFGDLSYTQTGTATVPQVGDQPAVTVPQYSSSISLNPEVQGLLNSSLAQQKGLSDAANTSLGQVQTALAKPLDMPGLPADYNQKVADALYNRSAAYLDPQWQQAETRERNRLANAGFSQQDQNYGDAYGNFSRAKDQAYADARNTAIAQGESVGTSQRQQAIQEALLQRQLPLSELNALRTGASPQLPQFQQTPAQGIGGADYLNAANASGIAKNQIYNADVGAYNANMGGLYGLGSAALMAYLMAA